MKLFCTLAGTASLWYCALITSAFVPDRAPELLPREFKGCPWSFRCRRIINIYASVLERIQAAPAQKAEPVFLPSALSALFVESRSGLPFSLLFSSYQVFFSPSSGLPCQPGIMPEDALQTESVSLCLRNVVAETCCPLPFSFLRPPVRCSALHAPVSSGRPLRGLC